MLKIFNTLNRQKEVFGPRLGKTIKMYACGVTVYDDCHIGHGRSLYVFEVIRRYLKYKGFKVIFVRNITDVDDKIIDKARLLSQQEGISLKRAFNKVRKTYIKSYYHDLKRLGIPSADKEPRATENIDDMQKYIRKLINKGIAYELKGNVYFSLREFPAYGKLSNKKTDELFSSVRIENDPLKKDPFDFALWKKAKEDEPCWGSPWGKGRPGWHIECSVMSQKYLKTSTLDIHGGGLDLIFPHHENEIAQVQALKNVPFARFWIHHGLLTINSQKMAKSLGNFVTISDVLNKYSADILKIFYLQAHHSSPIDFSWEKMEEAKKAYERLIILRDKLKKICGKKGEAKIRKDAAIMHDFRQQFIEAMDDDFNAPKGLAVLFDIVNECNKLLDSSQAFKNNDLCSAVATMKEIANIFGLNFFSEKLRYSLDKEIKDLIDLRLEYRRQKKFDAADKIRKELEVKGIILEDTKDKTVWRRKL